MMSTIGKRIHDRRIELGLSVDYVAERLGKNRATVYRYESDDIEKMPIDIVAPLAEVLRVSPAYIMGWTDNKEAMPQTEKEPAQKDEPERELFAKLFLTLTPENRKRILDLMQVLVEGQSSNGAPRE